MPFTPKLISGLTPLQSSTTAIEIQRGVASVAGFTPDTLIEVSADTFLTIDHVGPWGVDRGIAVGGVGWWRLWGIADSTGVLPGSMILAPSGSTLILPPGYNRLRFMGAAYYIKGSTAGMRRQVITSWPSPVSFIYQCQDAAENQIEVPSTASAWVKVSLDHLLPFGIARVAEISFTSVPISGSGGMVWVRTPGWGDGGFGVPSGQQASRRVNTNSINEIEVRTSTAAKCLLRVLGYEILSTY